MIGVLKGNGRIISSSAETQSERLVLLQRVGGKVVKIHRMKKEISCRIHYTASTVPRTGRSVCLSGTMSSRQWDHCKKKKKKNQGLKLQNGKP